MIKMSKKIKGNKEMKYGGIIRAKWSIDNSETLSEAAEKLEDFAKTLRDMEEDGIVLVEEIIDDYGFIETDNEEIAEKYGLNEKDEEDKD